MDVTVIIMANSELVVVHEASLEAAIAVHVQIPEFEAGYIKSEYPEKGIGDKCPYIVVGEVGAVAAGYMIGYEKPDSMHIWLAGVVPGYRRHGVFNAMIDAVADEAKARGRNILTVKSYERFDPMLQALAKLGFAQTSTDGGSIRFAKELSPNRHANS